LGFKIQPLIHIFYWILVIARISGREIKCFRLNPEGLHVYRKNPNEPDVSAGVEYRQDLCCYYTHVMPPASALNPMSFYAEKFESATNDQLILNHES
jgi:hypothetical protein